MRVLFLVGLMACGGEPEEAVVQPAVFEVQDPLPGAFVPAGEVPVTGVATGITAVTVNGEEAFVSGGTFTGQASLTPGLNLVEVAATQEDGDVMYVRNGVHAGPTEPAKAGAPYADAARLRVNQSGLDLLMEMGEDLVESIDPMALLGGGGGPLIEVPIEVFGIGLADFSASLQDVPGAISIEGLELVATPQANGLLQLEAVVDNVHVALDADVDFPFLLNFFDASSYIIVDAGLEATVLMSFGVVDGEIVLDAGLDAPSFTFTSFSLQTEFLGGILDTLADGFLEDIVRDLIVDQSDALIPGLLDGLLTDLPLALEFPLGEQVLAIEAVLTDGGIDEDGLFVHTDLAVDTGATCPGDVGHLVAPPADPVVPRSPDLGASISDDLANGVLLELWCSGLLELTLASDDPEFGTVVGLLLQPLQVTEGTVTVSAGLPPVLVARNGGLVLQVSELLMTIDTPGRVLGESITVMLHVDADLTVSIVDNAPRLVIGEARITTMSREHDWGASQEATTQLMEEALAPLLETLPALLNITLSSLVPPLDLDLFGLSIAEATVGRDAAGSDMSMDITLGYDPDALGTFTGF
ncbi:MAG: hypothetical protein ACI8PZ_005211 [Myxococcota bacterium]|jgi:hypothetical protein